MGFFGPNVLVVAVTAGVLDDLRRALGTTSGSSLAELLWTVTLLLALVALPLAAWATWIARRRHRRSPRSM